MAGKERTWAYLFTEGWTGEAWDKNTQVEVITWQWIYKVKYFRYRGSMHALVQESDEASYTSVTHVSVALDLWRWLKKCGQTVLQSREKSRESLFDVRDEPDHTYSTGGLGREELFVKSQYWCKKKCVRTGYEKTWTATRNFVAGAFFC